MDIFIQEVLDTINNHAKLDWHEKRQAICYFQTLNKDQQLQINGIVCSDRFGHSPSDKMKATKLLKRLARLGSNSEQDQLAIAG